MEEQRTRRSNRLILAVTAAACRAGVAMRDLVDQRFLVGLGRQPYVFSSGAGLRVLWRISRAVIGRLYPGDLALRTVGAVP